jgi:uncharacterized protein YbaR (Trm112 family)/SAM-dependent methyltransferase
MSTRTLRDLLVCPTCRGDLASGSAGLACAICNLSYPIIRGVPVLLPGAPREDLIPRFESELPPRQGYSKWKERLLVRSLSSADVALDFGCGYQALDDPNIVRMDACLHPYADVVGDVHHLPFRDGSVHLAFGGAVFEHLRDPWQAARELARVLTPGGFLYADWNFVFAYHGYPAHYFNASRDAVRETFGAVLDVVEVGVAPFQGPGAALRQVIGTYLAHFKAADREGAELQDQLSELLLRPLEALDRGIPAEHRHRTAAGLFVVACNGARGPEALISDEVWRQWEASETLRERYPDPRRLAEPGNILHALGETARRGSRRPCFSKDGSGRPRDPMVLSWPDELLFEPEQAADAELRRVMLARRRPMVRKLADALERPTDVAKLPQKALRWLTWRIRFLLGQTP